MKRYWWIALALVFVLAIPALAGQVIKISVDGTELKTDVPPQIIDGRTMVPLRAIAENFGKAVDYNEATRSITITGITELSGVEKVGAIFDQWATGVHNTLIEEATPYTRDGCVDCHTGNGFLVRESETPYLPATDENAPDPTTIDCATCHSGLGKELVSTGLVELPFMEGSYDAGKGALCMACHNGRKNPADLYAQSEARTITGLSYPHYTAAAALLSGKGGMEIPGASYGTATHSTIKDSCVTCHMPTNKKGYKNHSFKIEADNLGQACGSCHPTMTEDKYKSKQDAIKEMAAKVYDAVIAAVPGAVEMVHSHGALVFNDADGNPIDIVDVPHAAYVAAYNHELIASEGSWGAHNASYARDLLNESYKLLTGESLL